MLPDHSGKKFNPDFGSIYLIYIPKIECFHVIILLGITSEQRKKKKRKKSLAKEKEIQQKMLLKKNSKLQNPS